MRLKSNIGAVIGRLKRYQAGLPEAVQQATAVTYWRPRLERVALATLRAQWALERNLQTRAQYEAWTPWLLQSLLAESLPVGSRFSLGLEHLPVQGAGPDLAGASAYNLGQRTPTGRPQRYAIQDAESERNLDATRQAILDFVRLEKRRTDQDSGKTDEEIASRLEEILGVNDRAVPRERTEVMQEAAVRLMGAINEWLAGEGENPPPKQKPTGTPGLDPAVAASWLAAVLAAWRVYVEAHLRSVLEKELGKLHTRIQTELV